MLDPGIVSRFEALGVMYVRNYNSGLGLRWQEAFQTDDRGEVENQCRDERTSTSSGDRGIGSGRHRSAPRSAATRRRESRSGSTTPSSSHASSLEPSLREALLKVVPTDELPTTPTTATGRRSRRRALDEIRRVYDRHTVRFAWEAGDVLLLDNMLTAHGRESFSGHARWSTAMADPLRGRPVLSTRRPRHDHREPAGAR